MREGPCEASAAGQGCARQSDPPGKQIGKDGTAARGVNQSPSDARDDASHTLINRWGKLHSERPLRHWAPDAFRAPSLLSAGPTRVPPYSKIGQTAFSPLTLPQRWAIAKGIIPLEETTVRAKDLERLLVELTGLSAGEIDSRVRPLREKGLVPFGPRGRHAPHINAIHASAMLLALVSRRASDAGEVAHRLGNLHAVNPPGVLKTEDNDPQKRAPLLGCIAKYLHYAAEWPMPKIEATEDGELAWWYMDGSSPVLFTNDPQMRKEAEERPESYERQRDTIAERRFVFGRDFLKKIGLSIQDQGPRKPLTTKRRAR